jgi:DNA-binding transcriptional regulator YbjK
MPPNAARRRSILGAAIDILTDSGSADVTHRQIDLRAGMPAGTTSNYFRTRLALLEATARRLAELHWQHVADLQSALGRRGDRAGVVRLLARLIDDPDVAARRRQVARFEIFLESRRRPELRPFLDDIYASATESARLVLRWGGIDPTAEQIGQLTRVLSGLAFSHLTLPETALGGRDLTGMVGRLLDAFDIGIQRDLGR